MLRVKTSAWPPSTANSSSSAAVSLFTSNTFRIEQKYLSAQKWTGFEATTTWFVKKALNHLAKLAKWLSCVVSACLYGAFDCAILSGYMRDISSLSESNRIRTHNHVVRKLTLNHLVKLVKWLRCVHKASVT